jgi:serine/threonine-protein kinase RsbW
VGDSPMSAGALGLTVAAVPKSIPVVRRAVAEYARSCKADIGRVALATSEAVTNVVRHAYRGRDPGPVRLEATVEDSDLVITVVDEGSGVEPRLDSPGAGLGLAVMGSMASEVRIENSPDGLKVRMRFPCEESE